MRILDLGVSNLGLQSRNLALELHNLGSRLA
jgi:hypothetical protein